MKKLLLLIIFLSCWTIPPAQLSHGTTGLLHVPSADMQEDKTMMLGGNFLRQELTPPKLNLNTWNYCLNVTIFPSLEVVYTCTLLMAESSRLDKHGYSGFTNQNRYFSARLRVLKENKRISTVVLGTSDPFTSSGYKLASAIGSGYSYRYYLVATKHFQLGRGTLDIRLSYLCSRREDYPLSGVAGGTIYNPSFDPRLNVIAEYDPRDFAMGATCLLFNHIHFRLELQRMECFSGRLCYRIYLR